VVGGRAAHFAPGAIGRTWVLNIDIGAALTGAAFNLTRLSPMIVTDNLRKARLYHLAITVGTIKRWAAIGPTISSNSKSRPISSETGTTAVATAHV
jgi:hypothetical protein